MYVYIYTFTTTEKLSKMHIQVQGEGVKSDMPVYSQTSPWAQLKRVKSDIPQKVNQNISKQHGHTFRRDLFGIG